MEFAGLSENYIVLNKKLHGVAEESKKSIKGKWGKQQVPVNEFRIMKKELGMGIEPI